MFYISKNQYYLHLIFEFVALTIVVPVLIYFLITNWKKLNNFYRLFFILVISITLTVDGLLLCSFMNKNMDKNMNKTMNMNNNIQVKQLPELEKAEILLRQSARYAHAARQDKDILIALLHANYGTGYLWAAKDIFPESLLVKHFGSYKEFKEFERGIIEIQDNVNKLSVAKCPQIVSKKDIITKLGGEGYQ